MGTFGKSRVSKEMREGAQLASPGSCQLRACDVTPPSPPGLSNGTSFSQSPGLNPDWSVLFPYPIIKPLQLSFDVCVAVKPSFPLPLWKGNNCLAKGSAIPFQMYCNSLLNGLSQLLACPFSLSHLHRNARTCKPSFECCLCAWHGIPTRTS